jgi:type IX secretion system substrate protein
MSGSTSAVHCGAFNCFRGFELHDLCELTMSDCVVSGSEYDDISVSSAFLYGDGNILYGGGSSCTIQIANAAACFNNNRIESSNGYTLKVNYHISPDVDLDFTSNYWGSSNPDSITTWIWDGVDDPSLGITVDYLPLQPGSAWAGIEDDRTPLAPSVLEIYPNPFNPSTTIRFNLDEPQHTKVAVYDISGRLIKTLLDEFTFGGEQTINWNGRDAAGRAVSSGSYFVRLQGDRDNEVRKVMLLR